MMRVHPPAVFSGDSFRDDNPLFPRNDNLVGRSPEVAGAMPYVYRTDVFELPLFEASDTVRTGVSQWVAEFVATCDGAMPIYKLDSNGMPANT